LSGHGGDRKSIKRSNERLISQEEAAKAHGIGIAGLRDARVIREDAPDQEDDVKAGKIAIRQLATKLRAKRSNKMNGADREKQLLALPQMPQLSAEELGRPSAEEGDEQHPDMPAGWTNNLVHSLEHGLTTT
jgi:hypothetical protein